MHMPGYKCEAWVTGNLITHSRRGFFVISPNKHDVDLIDRLGNGTIGLTRAGGS